MRVPIVTERVGGIDFRWPDCDLRITAERFDEAGRCELGIWTDSDNGFVDQKRVDLLSTSAINSLAKRLQSFPGDGIVWDEVLAHVTGTVLKVARAGEPVVQLWGKPETQRPEYLVDSLVVKSYPNIIFGDPGSFKSALAALLIAIITLPWRDNPLELRCPARPTGCLFLDWETDAATVDWTLARLFQGHGLPSFPVHYRRCSLPLPHDVDALRAAITEAKAEVVVIDSLGMASGGDDLNRSGAAIGFYTALRQLNVTSIVLAHNSKDRETKARSIIGHQYYTAQARNIWEVRKVQDAGDDEIDLALFHRKPPPFAKLAAPVGAHVTFTADSMRVRAQNATTVREFVTEMGLKAQISEVLQNGAMSVNDIARETGAKYDSARRVLYRMRDKRQVFQVEGGKWGLALEQ